MTEPTSLPAPLVREFDEHELVRDRLGASVRALLDLVTRTGATTRDIEVAADAVDAASAALATAPLVHHQPDSPFHSLSLVGGSAHPVAPQLTLEPTADGVAGIVRLGPAFEGGPGLAHGGVLALLFDHAMGAAVYLAGHAAMTRALDVVYSAPPPLNTDLVVTARVDRVEGRKVRAEATIGHGDIVTATATAVFVTLTRDNVARIFRPGTQQL